MCGVGTDDRVETVVVITLFELVVDDTIGSDVGINDWEVEWDESDDELDDDYVVNELN